MHSPLDIAAAINGYMLPSGHSDPEEIAEEFDKWPANMAKPNEGPAALARHATIVIDQLCHMGRIKCTEKFRHAVWLDWGNLNKLMGGVGWDENSGKSFGEFWDKYGSGILTIGGFVVFGVCVAASGGACVAAGVVLASATTLDAMHALPDNPTAEEKKCAGFSIAVAWGSVAVPGARVNGKAFWDTPWTHFFQGSAAQTAALGTGMTLTKKCSGQ